MHRDNTGNKDLLWVKRVDFLSLDFLGGGGVYTISSLLLT